MERDEHLQRAKDRALEYARNGKENEAIGSLISDLSKHEALADHLGIELGSMLLATGRLSTYEQVIDWIDGFN